MYAGSRKDEAGVLCIDCHMARTGSRSRATSKSTHLWDTAAHVFSVATPTLEKTLGVRSARASCHDDGKPISGRTAAGGSMKQTMIGEVQARATEVRAGIAEVHVLLARAEAHKPDKAARVHEARSKLAFIQADNSKGNHNIVFARRLLREARTLAERAAAR
jgi:hypothetical protein